MKTIIDYRMAHEGAARLLELIKGYGWSKENIVAQEQRVAECKAERDAAERAWA